MLITCKRSLALLFATSLMLLSAIGFADELQFNMTEGVTEVSKEVFELHMLIFWICVVIGVVVFGAMFISMFLHRKSRGAEASHFHESITLELVWTIVPALILIFMAIPATSTLKKIYDTEEAELDILITGYQWNWKYEYLGQNVSFYSNLSTPKEQIRDGAEKGEHYLLEVDKAVVIPADTKVRFLVTAGDVIHSWWVPELAVKRDAIPGYTNAAWTYVEGSYVDEAKEKGERLVYRGQCAELCGKDHGFMPIEVEVVSKEDYATWIDGKRAEAAAIAEAAKQTLTLNELIAQGEQVYTNSCSGCHGAKGEGVASFPAIAGSAIAQGAVSEHLNRVINGGQGMPPFGEQLTPVEAAAVITFQRNAFGNNMGDLIQPIDVVEFKQGQ